MFVAVSEMPGVVGTPAVVSTSFSCSSCLSSLVRLRCACGEIVSRATCRNRLTSNCAVTQPPITCACHVVVNSTSNASCRAASSSSSNNTCSRYNCSALETPSCGVQCTASRASRWKLAAIGRRPPNHALSKLPSILYFWTNQDTPHVTALNKHTHNKANVNALSQAKLFGFHGLFLLTKMQNAWSCRGQYFGRIQMPCVRDCSSLPIAVFRR